MRILSLLDKNMNKKIAKKNSSSDISIYIYKKDNRVFEIIEPSLFPEKIQPLLYGFNLSDYIIIGDNTLENKFLGEEVLCCKLCKKPGFVIQDSQISRFLPEFEKISNNAIEIREKLLSLKNIKKQTKKIIIEQVFNLKSIGTVVIGNVCREKIKVHDKLTLFPSKKEISIKSLQAYDKDVKEINAGNKAGINIKGEKAENIKRGYVLGERLNVGNKIYTKIKISKFVNGKIEGKQFICIGLQTAECKLSANPGEEKEIELSLNKEICWEKNEKFFIFNPNKNPRVIGYGEIL